MFNFHIRPYDTELLELLLMLEAAEQSGERGWKKVAGKEAEEGNVRARKNLREDTLKEDIEFWPQQQMVSNQVQELVLLPLCTFTFIQIKDTMINPIQIKDTSHKGLAVPDEELMPGDHWIHRDFTPVVTTVRPMSTLSISIGPYTLVRWFFV